MKVYPKRTQKVIDYIDANYLTMPVRHMAKALEVSPIVVKTYMREKGYPLNLFKDASKYRQGQVAPNKGKKFPVEKQGVKGQFKKGQVPQNFKPIGVIRIRKSKQGNLKWIKIGYKKWQLYAQYVWIEHNGAIPEGLVVYHKDKNSLNCSIENLELITRKELRVRNAGSVNLTDNFVLRTITKDKAEQEIITLRASELIKIKRSILQIRRHAKNGSSPNSAT